MDKSVRQKAMFQKFQRVQPKQVTVSQDELVKRGYVDPERRFPSLLEPANVDVDLVEWTRHHRQELDRDVLECGAVLMRGFGHPTEADFERFATTVCRELFVEYGDLPQTEGAKIYGVTPYPPEQTILFHNEASHTHRWPLRQMFLCLVPAEEGGESLLVDGRRVYAALDPEVRQRFETQGLLYMRNFTAGFDIHWKDFFRTPDRSEVEAYCRRSGIGFEWHGDDLRTSFRTLAVTEHPKSGEKIWFNQIQLHHISTVDPETRKSLESIFSPEALPRNVYYGDGTAIPEDVVAHVSEILSQESASVLMREGDVLLLDNMLVAHSRAPYRGKRRVMVAMGDTVEAAELANAVS